MKRALTALVRGGFMGIRAQSIEPDNSSPRTETAPYETVTGKDVLFPQIRPVHRKFVHRYHWLSGECFPALKNNH